MKKRIIASTMASVMALSAASSLIASADVADFKDQSVNKTTLRKLTEDKEIVDLVENDGLANYGSISGANFLKAYDYAKAVVDDVEIDANGDQVTVAYLMLKAAKDALVQYTADDLKILVEQCRGIRDTNNELNDHGDAKYDGDAWSKFVEAFDEADDYKEYDDILVTTDAYEKLDAVKKPKELETVTKLRIDTARANYEKALQMEFKYQPWVRGKVTGSGTNYDNIEYAWGTLYAHVKSGQEYTQRIYDGFDNIKGLTVTSDTDIVKVVKALENAAKVLNGFSANYETGSSQSSVNRLLAQYHGQMVYTYNADMADEILQSFITTVGASNLEFKFEDKFGTVDGTSITAGLDSTGGTKATYWNTKYSSASDIKLYGSNGGTTANKVEKLIAAELTVRHTLKDGVWYVVNNNKKLANGNGRITALDGGNDGTLDDYFFTSEALASAALARSVTDTAGYQIKTLKVDTAFTLSSYIPVDSSDVLDTLSISADTTATAVKDAANDVIQLVSSMAGKVSAIATAVSTVITNLGSTDVNKAAASNGANALTTAEYETLNTKLTTLYATLTTLNATMGSVSGAASADDLTTISGFDELVSNVDSIISTIKGLKVPTSFTATNAAATAVVNGLGTNIGEALWGAGSTASGPATTSFLGIYNAASPTLSSLISTYKKEYNKTIIAAAANGYGQVKAKDSSSNDTLIDAYLANNVVDHTTESITSSKGFNLSSFTYAAYSSSKNNGIDMTKPAIARAMNLLEMFNAKEGWSAVTGLDNTGYVTGELKDGNAPTSRAWTVLYTYMKYALEDEFSASAAKTYTLKEIKTKLDDAYKLATDTVEASIFNPVHMNLFNWRNAASQWVKLADAYAAGAYKDNDTKIDTTYTSNFGTSRINGDSTAAYKKLSDAYDLLNNELKAFKYSYEEIIAKMAAIAKALDANTFDAATTEKLAKELNDTALAFVKVDAVYLDNNDTLEDSELFNADGTINIHNRLFTNKSKFEKMYVGGVADSNKRTVLASEKDGDNHTHYDMQVAYEKLVDDYNAALKGPATPEKTTDINGDGIDFNVADITYFLKLFVDDKTEVSKHDFTNDGKVTVDDIKWLLKEFTSK